MAEARLVAERRAHAVEEEWAQRKGFWENLEERAMCSSQERQQAQQATLHAQHDAEVARAAAREQLAA